MSNDYYEIEEVSIVFEMVYRLRYKKGNKQAREVALEHALKATEMGFGVSAESGTYDVTRLTTEVRNIERKT